MHTTKRQTTIQKNENKVPKTQNQKKNTHMNNCQLFFYLYLPHHNNAAYITTQCMYILNQSFFNKGPMYKKHLSSPHFVFNNNNK
eukprot:UN04211